jgi:hypothetical protein
VDGAEDPNHLLLVIVVIVIIIIAYGLKYTQLYCSAVYPIRV